MAQSVFLTSVSVYMTACKLACGVLAYRVDLQSTFKKGAYVVNCILGDVKYT